ncbi:META domain-containing protein [bacterium]|nr:META domain-containing protein [bacterium]
MNIKTIAAAMGLAALAACGNGEETVSLAGKKFVSSQPDTTITMAFDENEMRVYGRVVNMYNGPYSIDGHNIKFGNIASTMMMGPAAAMDTEREYFQFLSTATKYDITDGRLTLTNDGGKEIVFQQVDELPTDDE